MSLPAASQFIHFPHDPAGERNMNDEGYQDEADTVQKRIIGCPCGLRHFAGPQRINQRPQAKA